MVLAGTGLLSPLRQNCSWVILDCENRHLETIEVAFLTFHFIAKVYISAIRGYIMCKIYVALYCLNICTQTIVWSVHRLIAACLLGRALYSVY